MARIELDRRKQKTKDLENLLPPLEIAKFIEEDDQGQLPFTLRPLFASGERPVHYVRESWHDAVNYYTANCGARRLIVAFCCGGNGLGIPTAYFLQMLREETYDVLVLHDRRKLHYDRGVEGFSDSLLETVRRIDSFAKAKHFDEVVTFGVSMGAYAALRAGILLDAKRAISVGGVYFWPMARLLKGKVTPKAFDLLCPCFSDRQAELIAVTPSLNKRDMTDLEILRRTFPAVHPVLVDTERHNVMGYMHNVQLLRLFCACLFEHWDSDIRAELLSLLNRTARYSSNVAALQAERRLTLRDEIDRIYASRSWRLTKPLRRLAEMVRGLKQT